MSGQKRFLLNSNGLRLSAPGIDVDAAVGVDDLLFDNTAAQLSILFRGRGFMYPTDPRDSATVAARDIMFPGGRVFDKAPLGFFGWGMDSTVNYGPGIYPSTHDGQNVPSPPTMTDHLYMTFGADWHYYIGDYSTSEYPNSGTPETYYYQIKSMTDRLRILWYFSQGDSVSPPTANMTFYYAVVDYT